jgi:hypothetical protein
VKQVALKGCVVTSRQLPKSGVRVLTKRNCVTNAENDVRTRVFCYCTDSASLGCPGLPGDQGKQRQGQRADVRTRRDCPRGLISAESARLHGIPQGPDVADQRLAPRWG